MASASNSASPSTASPPPPPSTQPPHHPSPPSASLSPSPQSHHLNDPPIATALPLLMPAPVAPASSRRLPPPCWTPEETSALIDAYRDKWYSLRRGNLRAVHWQEVADDVHHRCPNASSPKTAVQCRHKMEKLRKRYRAELQRAKSIPHHRFSSSWVYFSKMDAMEKGPNASPSVSLSSPPLATVVAAPVTAACVNNLNDVDEEGDEDEDEGDEDYAYRNYDPRRDFNRDYTRNGLRIKIPGNSGSGSGCRSKRNFGDFDENPNVNTNPSYGYKQKYGNINSFSSPSPPQFEEGMRYGTRVVKNSSNGSAGSSGMNANMNSIMMKKRTKTGLGKRDREDKADDAAMEMVEAIRMLGEGFVKMEKMKMEMMRESERMRMEMEMKRTEMILESQHLIVEAFAKGWADSMKVKKDASY